MAPMFKETLSLFGQDATYPSMARHDDRHKEHQERGLHRYYLCLRQLQ